MTVRTTDLESEFALDALERKLAGAGLTVRPAAERSAAPLRCMTVEWSESNKDILLAILRMFVASDWQYAYIERRIASLHPYLSPEEREYVSLLTFHALKRARDDADDGPSGDWVAAVMHAIGAVVDQDPFLNLDGVIRFRAREYLAGVEQAIEEMVEQFLADREYEEFVAMLRYMLEEQPQSAQALHVFCSDDKVWICDAAGNLIRDTEIHQAAEEASEGEDVNPEDLAMSILITRAPYSIVIHDVTTMAPWPSFAETVERVFLDRARRCPGCDDCRDLRRTQAMRLMGKPNPPAAPNPID